MNSEYAKIRNEVDVLIENLLRWLFVISVISDQCRGEEWRWSEPGGSAESESMNFSCHSPSDCVWSAKANTFQVNIILILNEVNFPCLFIKCTESVRVSPRLRQTAPVSCLLPPDCWHRLHLGTIKFRGCDRFLQQHPGWHNWRNRYSPAFLTPTRNKTTGTLRLMSI